MAQHNGSRIVTDGLVLALDAANPKSYPGTGTTWFDLTGNGHNVVLGSGVTHLSDFNDVFNFPENANGTGENNTINLSSSDNTVITFSRKNVTGNDGRLVTARNNNWLLGHHDTTYGDYFAEGWIYNGAGTSDDTWRMFTGTGNITTDTWQLYINDNLIVSNASGSQGPNGFNLNDGGFDQYSDGQISLLLCYNRVLSAGEIAQNFQALRGRYG